MKIICFKAKRALGGAGLLALALAVMWAMRAVGTYAVGAISAAAFAAHLLGGEGGEKIAISFDCAWGTEHTDAILKAMEQNDVKCTFFMVQFWTEKYPEYVKKSTRRDTRSARTARRIPI